MLIRVGKINLTVPQNLVGGTLQYPAKFCLPLKTENDRKLKSVSVRNERVSKKQAKISKSRHHL